MRGGPRATALLEYSPDQPRIPGGKPGGGRWGKLGAAPARAEDGWDRFEAIERADVKAAAAKRAAAIVLAAQPRELRAAATTDELEAIRKLSRNVGHANLERQVKSALGVIGRKGSDYSKEYSDAVAQLVDLSGEERRRLIEMAVNQPRVPKGMPGGGRWVKYATGLVQQVLPNATVRQGKNGLEVGGFSQPPATAQKLLRDAGLDVTDDWGQTVVRPPTPIDAERAKMPPLQRGDWVRRISNDKQGQVVHGQSSKGMVTIEVRGKKGYKVTQIVHEDELELPGAVPPPTAPTAPVTTVKYPRTRRAFGTLTRGGTAVDVGKVPISELRGTVVRYRVGKDGWEYGVAMGRQGQSLRVVPLSTKSRMEWIPFGAVLEAKAVPDEAVTVKRRYRPPRDKRTGKKKQVRVKTSKVKRQDLIWDDVIRRAHKRDKAEVRAARANKTGEKRPVMPKPKKVKAAPKRGKATPRKPGQASPPAKRLAALTPGAYVTWDDPLDPSKARKGVVMGHHPDRPGELHVYDDEGRDPERPGSRGHLFVPYEKVISAGGVGRDPLAQENLAHQALVDARMQANPVTYTDPLTGQPSVSGTGEPQDKAMRDKAWEVYHAAKEEAKDARRVLDATPRPWSSGPRVDHGRVSSPPQALSPLASPKYSRVGDEVAFLYEGKNLVGVVTEPSGRKKKLTVWNDELRREVEVGLSDVHRSIHLARSEREASFAQTPPTTRTWEEVAPVIGKKGKVVQRKVTRTEKVSTSPINGMSPTRRKQLRERAAADTGSHERLVDEDGEPQFFRNPDFKPAEHSSGKWPNGPGEHDTADDGRSWRDYTDDEQAYKIGGRRPKKVKTDRKGEVTEAEPRGGPRARWARLVEAINVRKYTRIHKGKLIHVDDYDRTGDPAKITAPVRVSAPTAPKAPRTAQAEPPKARTRAPAKPEAAVGQNSAAAAEAPERKRAKAKPRSSATARARAALLQARREKMRPATPEERKAHAIPPAWTNVMISDDPEATGGLQFRGHDAAGRPQPRYTDEHNDRQAAEKYQRVAGIHKALPVIDQAIRENDDDAHRILMVVRKVGLRPGGESDTKAKVQAYGASQLEARHVTVEGSVVTFDFIGKGGKHIPLEIEDAEMAEMFTQALANKAPGDQLFPDANADQVRRALGRAAPGFKVKDLRTHRGTAEAMRIIEQMPEPRNATEMRKARAAVGDHVAALLGNTRSMALNHYINPVAFDRWRERTENPEQIKDKALVTA